MSVVSPHVKQIPIEIQGGLCTFIDPENLPPGASPDCQDCEFLPGEPGTTRTRPGLVAVHQFAGNPTINYQRTFIDPEQNVRNLFFDSLQRLWQENPQGTFTQVLTEQGEPVAYQSAYVKSDTAFGREFMAFSDGKFGTDIPMQFDGSVTKRVSQVGPGRAPNASDINVAISSISRTSGIISVTTAAAHGLSVGGLVTISGVTADGTFNGTWPVASVGSPTTFTAWGNPGQYAIGVISRTANVVTAVLSSTPFVSASDTIIVGEVNDPSFDGEFTVASVSGNTVTWPQVAPNAASTGGILFIKAITLPIVALDAIEGVSASLITAVVPVLSGQALPFTTGGEITVAGNGTSGLDGTYPITGIFPTSQQTGTVGPFGTAAPGSIPNFSSLQALYPQAVLWSVQFPISATPTLALPLGTASASVPDASPTASGVAGPFGNISSGLHRISVIFVTDTGYFSAPAPPNFWDSTGGFQALAIEIPTGPPNVVARIIILTPAGSANFFYNEDGSADILATRINDNTTTTLLLDFSDAALIGSEPGDLLFNRVELGECAGMISYAQRTLWWGERNKVFNFLNLTFDGGFNGSGFGALPLGWNADESFFTGGGQITNPVVWGAAYGIRGRGMGEQVTRGLISQSAFQDAYGVPILLPNQNYSVRARLAQDGGLDTTHFTFNVKISSVSSGFSTVVSVGASLVTTSYAEFILNFADVMPVKIPDDMVLSIYASCSGTTGGGHTMYIDDLEIFPTDTPYILSSVRVSNAFDPEAFDDATGRLNVNESDGQRVVCLAVIRERLYIHKEGGWFATQDNGNEPGSENGWQITPVSTTVGAASINSCGAKQGEAGSEWYVTVSPLGLYIFWGDSPEKISQEIQISNGLSSFSWDAVNWAYGHTAWVVVDIRQRRLLVGLPLGDATSPNVTLAMDFKAVGTADGIASSPEVHMSSYSGKQVTLSGARKYCPWTATGNSAGMILRNDGEYHLFIGDGTGNGKIYDLTTGQTTDDGVNISAYYQTSYYPSDEQKTNLQLPGGIVLLSYTRQHVEGSGTLTMTAYGPGNINFDTIPPSANGPALATPMKWDLETYANFFSDRIAIKISATGAQGSGPVFSAQKMDLYVQANPTSMVRGFN